ncbi:MAG: J domain-containing protein [Polyangiales bacterium]
MSDDRLDQLDYYTLLGVGADADAPSIKRAFRRFARRYHPDRFAGGPPEKVARANAIYRRGSEAVQVLTDPAARRAYDAVLGSGKVRMSAEERDRALYEAREASQPKKKRPEDSIGSPQARAFHDKAVASAKRGDWRGAWKLLKQALELEPGNKVLEKKLRKCEGRLRSG